MNQVPEFIFSCILRRAISALVYLIGVRQSSHEIPKQSLQYSINFRVSIQNNSIYTSIVNEVMEKQLTTYAGLLYAESPSPFSYVLNVGTSALVYLYGCFDSRVTRLQNIAYNTWTLEFGLELSDIKSMQ